MNTKAKLLGRYIVADPKICHGVGAVREPPLPFVAPVYL